MSIGIHFIKRYFTIVIVMAIVCYPIDVFSIKKKPIVNSYNELKQLSKKIAEKRYSARVKIMLFNDKSKSEILETRFMEMDCWDNFYHSKVNNMEYFVNKEYKITINHSEKIILVDKNYISKTNKSSNEFLPFIIDTGRNNIYDKEILENNGTTKTFLFKSKLAENKIEKLLIKVDCINTKPISCEIQYADNLNKLLGKVKKSETNKKPKIILEYTTFNYPQKINEKDFDFSEILTISKSKEIKLAAKYKTFELVNYLKKRK